MIAEMVYPQGNVLLGGVGRPGYRRVLFTVATGDDFRPIQAFDQAMKAIMSNAKAGDNDVAIVCERRMQG